jgi:predicted kinase
VCLARNQARADRRVSPEVVEKQVADLTQSLPGLEREGYLHVYVLDNAKDIDSARISPQLSNV